MTDRELELRNRIAESGDVPRHLAIIMDGNGRWALGQSLPRLAGHRAGVGTVREIVRASAELGIEVLTLYAFSVENWRRPKSEVSGLMKVLRDTLRGETPELDRNNVRFDAIGRLDDLPQSVRDQIDESRRALASNDGLLLILALSYGGRPEIVDAARALARDVQAGRLDPEAIDEETFAGHLYTKDLPDPDLLIRTSGEMRISNFLLWQIAYSEIWVTETAWPDFRREHLYTAILDYQRRDRRFGDVESAKSALGRLVAHLGGKPKE
jgi:undecaprenyl diphosphate synthase